MRQYILLVLLSFAVLTAHIEAQDYQINFAGRGASSTVESVEVQNLTQNTSITLTAGQILHLKGVATSVNDYIMDNNNMVIYPNPITEIGYIEFTSEYSEQYNFNLYDLMGRKVLSNSFFLEKGNHQFTISGLKQGTYLLNLYSTNYANSGKILCTISSGGSEQINYVGHSIKEKRTGNLKNASSNNLVEMQYNEGDRLLLTASSGIYKTVKTIMPTSSTVETIFFVECKDGDDNIYKVVQIGGGQIWMAENLRSTKYSDGSSIPHIPNDTEWANLDDNNSSKAYSFYNNNETLGYGVLYTYAAAINETPHDGIDHVQGVCPTGWHLPSDTEWTQLENYLIANGYNYDGTTSVDKTAWALTSTSGWMSTTGVGGVVVKHQGINSTGFSALPGGYRNNYTYGISSPYTFVSAGERGFWWSSSEYSSSEAYSRQLFNNSEELLRYNYAKSRGYSVRCMRDNITITSPQGGEEWARGSSRTITWDSHLTSNVRIELWNEVGMEYIIASGVENNGVYLWNIPTDLTKGDKYKIKIIGNSDESINDESDRYFSIIESESLTVSDYEGNIYETVKIGNQLWMAENLRSTKYSDGSSIPHIPNDTEWANLDDNNSSKAYSFYNNNETLGYGVLYTYAAAVNGTPHNGTHYVQGVCPTGWHLPSKEEWAQLENYLIVNGYNYDNTTYGDKTAKSMASTFGWRDNSIVGNVGNNQNSNNTSGFTALAGGYRYYHDGSFNNSGSFAMWWCSTQDNTSNAYYQILRYNSMDLTSAKSYTKSSGLSVRCIKD